MPTLLRMSALVATVPYVFAVALLVTGKASWSSIAYAAAFGALLGGLVTLPQSRAGCVAVSRRRWRPRGLSRGALAVLAAIAFVRVLVVGEGRSLRIDRGGSQDRGRFVNRLVEEGAVAVLGTRLMLALGTLKDDREELPGAMRRAYSAMRREEGDMASPFAATYLGLQRPAAFDLITIEPPTARIGARPRGAVIFLHGYLGNFDLPCWQMAKVVASLDVVTLCPSTRWVGDWWSPEGEATLHRTVDVAHARGIDRIVLAGLSTGALAPRAWRSV